MLRINNGITDLNLCNNDLRETGVRELCSSVVENEKLRTIRLVNNAKMGTEVVSEYACVCARARERAHVRARQTDRQRFCKSFIFLFWWAGYKGADSTSKIHGTHAQTSCLFLAYRTAEKMSIHFCCCGSSVNKSLSSTLSSEHFAHAHSHTQTFILPLSHSLSHSLSLSHTHTHKHTHTHIGTHIGRESERTDPNTFALDY